jgi:predicted transposase/invertase (TIGR01784 family)
MEIEITREKLFGTFEQKKEIVSQFNLLDDDFFAVVMRNKEACSYTLSKLLDTELEVIDVQTQYSIRNMAGHSVILDALAVDTNKKVYNIEVQVKNNDYHPKRVRYYQSSLDTLLLEKSQNYKELPELYLIFISEKDWLKGGKCKYTVKRILEETGEEIDNGVHEYYFNADVTDGTFLSDLLQYFKNSSSDNNKFGALSQTVYHHKIEEEGVEHMCQAVDNYAKKEVEQAKAETKIETEIATKVRDVQRLMQAGYNLDEVLEIIGIDKETYGKNVNANS